MRSACNSRCAIAGPAGTTTGGFRFRRPRAAQRCRSRCDRARAGRRELAAARVGRRMGRTLAAQGRGDIAAAAGQLRVHGRLVRYLPRPLRRPAAQGHRAVVRLAARCAAKLSITRTGIEGGAIYALSAELREAIVSVRGRRRLHIALRPDLDTRRSGRAAVRAARQAIVFQLAAQGSASVAGRYRPVAGGGDCVGCVAVVAVGGKPRRIDQCRAGRTHRHRADRARDFDRGRNFVRRTRRRFHDPPLARRVRGRRNAGLGSADRRLSAAGVVCDGGGGGEGGGEVAQGGNVAK